MNNHLDLRKKQEPKIIEKIVFKRRPWHTEALKFIMVVMIATGAVWAISKADQISSIVSGENPTKSFSAIGFISNISNGVISIERADGSDGRTNASYSFSIASVSTIETSDYVALPVALLRVGDQVIVQGTETNGVIVPTRIVSFAQISAEEIAVAQLALVMLDGSTASSTDDSLASSTASSTPSSSSSGSQPSEGVTPEGEGDIVFASTTSDVITSDIATSTATSTEPVATSTATTTDPVATSTLDVVEPTVTATSTESAPETVPEPAPEVAPEPTPEPVPESVPAESAPASDTAPAPESVSSE
jgi:hypothetical protein